MKNIVLFISFAVTLLPNINGNTYGENLLNRLNSEIDYMNDLIILTEELYRDQQLRCPNETLSRNYEDTLKKANATIDKSSRFMDHVTETNRRNGDKIYEDSNRRSLSGDQRQNSNQSTHRSNQREWKSDFYKALSRAVKTEFKDDPAVQENIHDGFVPPIQLQNGGDQ